MYQKDFEVLVEKKKIPKSLLLYGERYFVEFFVQKIFDLIGAGDNVLKFYFEEYDFSLAKKFISQPSLFLDINLLYIKTDKKLAKKELNELIKLCNVNVNSYFVLEFIGEDRVAKEISLAFNRKENADFVRFFKPDFNQAINILNKEAKRLNLNIDFTALKELYFIQNEDLLLCINELRKLCLLNKRIDVFDIKNYVFGLGEIFLDDFIIKLLTKRDIKEELENILARAYDEIRIINSIENFIAMLLEFHLYIKAYGRVDSKDILGYALPKQIENQRASLAIRFTPLQFEIFLKELIECEFMLKNKKNLQKKAYLYSTLIKLQSFL